MRRAPWVALALAVALFAGVVTWYLTHRPRMVNRTVTTPAFVVVSPAVTPLRDSIREPRRKTSKKKETPGTVPSREKGTGDRPVAPTGATPKSPTQAGAHRSPSPPRKHQTATTKPQPAPAPQSAPSAPPASPGVTVPLPSVCLPPVRVGNCP